MTRLPSTLSLFAILLAWPHPAIGESSGSPLHGSLQAGPHAVGFTTIRMADASRPPSTREARSGQPSIVRAREVVVHVWYPAVPGSGGAPMTFADAMIAHLEGAPAAERQRREADTRRFLAQFGAVSDDAWDGLRKTTLLAHRDATPAPGRFPLLIGELRPLSTSITNEYLASHGFVVGMVDGEEGSAPTDPGAGLDVGYRDMEFGVAELRKLPYVDPISLGALGFSGSGFSQLLLAMRHPDVKAVCDLESAIFDDRMMWPLSRGWGYDVGALRVPFLHTYSVTLSKLENRIADFENMRYSTRYRYLVDVPGIHHWDFATEGMAASTVIRNRGEHGDRLRQAFETTNRYVLAFFNAYIKGDANELAFLRRDPQANGAPAGLATIRELPGIQPAPTSTAFARMLTEQGIEKAMAAFAAARATDPLAPLFRESELNALGYRLLRQQKAPEAIAVFRKAVEMYPASSNPYDSLSEALETTGDRAGALEVARKGLEVLARQDLSDASRQPMKELLEGRVKRMQGA